MASQPPEAMVFTKEHYDLLLSRIGDATAAGLKAADRVDDLRKDFTALSTQVGGIDVKAKWIVGIGAVVTLGVIGLVLNLYGVKVSL